MNLEDLVNKGILDLSPYKPGKPIEDLERELGIKNAIKLASNENPLGPSPLAIDAVNKVLNGTHRYPDGNALRLKECLSNKFKVDINCLTIGNGSNDIIEFIARSFLSDKDSAIYSEHAFAVYPLVVQAVGAEGIEVPAIEYGHDLEEMLKAVKENTKLVFIANPNNPTGTFLSPKEIESFLDNLDKNIIVLLDQAYFDYSSYSNEDISFDLINNYPNVIISRSFSKAYGLAGFRIGYSVSSPEVADYLNRVRQPFNANSLALVAAEVALSDESHLKKSLEINLDQKTILMKGLRNLGYECIPSEGNFISFNSNGKGQKLFEDLLNEGVIVRTLGVYKMPNHLRATIGLPEENSIFLEKLSTLS